MCSDGKQTRRQTAARLLLFCLGFCCAAIFLVKGADTVLSRAAVSARIVHEDQPIERALPDTEGKMDINQATAKDLQKVHGIGPALSQRILDEREVRNGFHFLEELMDVSGIGEKRYEALCELFYCPVSVP